MSKIIRRKNYKSSTSPLRGTDTRRETFTVKEGSPYVGPSFDGLAVNKIFNIEQTAVNKSQVRPVGMVHYVIV